MWAVEITVAIEALPELPAVDRGESSRSVTAGREPIAAPRVTVGNGRSPGASSGQADTLPDRVNAVSAIVLSPHVAPPPAVATMPIPLAPVELPVQRLTPAPPVASASPFVGTLQTGWPAGVLFGVAGLILAPIGGVWLGHRQARAAKAAEHLVSR